ncbi:MAG: magnesium/cobalt transporter CorA, partial [Myxococcales bacterium]|nr:magnesium/cobalt transporter CorA [Myxococcales bacterium]
RTPAVGAAPGDLVVPPGGAASRIRAMAFDREHLVEREVEDPGALRSFMQDGRTVWLDVHGFGDAAVLHQLRDVLELHPLAMADIVNVPQRPKAEAYGDRLLIVLRMARVLPGGHVEFEQVSIVIGPGWVATFQEQEGDVFDGVRERVRAAGSKLRQMGADYLAYTLLDAIVDGYFPVVESCGDVLDALEEEVVDSPTHGTLSRIHAARRLLMSLHQTQWRQRDAIAVLLRDDSSVFTEPVRVYLRDIHDHAMQTLDAIETFREMCVGLIDIYLSGVSNRLNEVMKTLTVVASIFIPLTFIVGVYGMNFRDMPELGWRWGYPGVWIVMLAVTVGMLLSFRRRGWLERRSRGRRP